MDLTHVCNNSLHNPPVHIPPLAPLVVPPIPPAVTVVVTEVPVWLESLPQPPFLSPPQLSLLSSPPSSQPSCTSPVAGREEDTVYFCLELWEASETAPLAHWQAGLVCWPPSVTVKLAVDPVELSLCTEGLWESR